MPDFENLRRTLLRRGPPGPVPFFEIFADPGLMQAALGEAVSWESIIPDLVARDESGVARAGLDATLRFCVEFDYDYVWAWSGLFFPRANMLAATDTAQSGNFVSGARIWQDERAGPIQSQADFERYPWPRLEHVSYAAIEYLSRKAPEGMQVCAHIPGIFENASWLMGLVSFSYALHDQPELIASLFRQVGDLAAAVLAESVSLDGVGMCMLGDDLGYASGTMVSPAVLREHVFPQYRRLIEIAHAADKPIVLHSCGNLEQVMDEIAGLGFDAKHSFEDKIMPVEEVQRRWGDRVAVLGGVDMDLLARGDEADVRKRTRAILEACAAGGTGYALGSGNSAANYVRLENFRAMLDEGRRWNREHFPAASARRPRSRP
jgi:uroporphyrinogen decarboxylase